MTAFKSIALIPAAGSGKRMCSSVNKQYMNLSGLPILARTIAVFEQSPQIDAIYLVVPAEEITYCREHVVEAHGFRKVAAIVPGGKERQNSVMNGLLAIRQAAGADDVILIHDGVRPFITAAIIAEAIKIARCNDGALVAVPCKDTIKTVCEDFVFATPPRETLWQAQTPQAFRLGTILEAHLAAEKDGYTGTDDASLVERQGGKIRVLRGDYRNIKITTPDDLVLAETFFSAEDGASQ